MSVAIAVDDVRIGFKHHDGRAEPPVATGIVRSAAGETRYVCRRFPER
jgi:hypothetical protein